MSQLPDEVLIFEDELFSMPTRDLAEHFSHANGALDHVRLTRNLIWQDHQRIRSAQLPQAQGNIRSYWYARVKPVMARMGLRGDDLAGTYGTLIDQLAEIVREGWMTYVAWGFSDHNASLRRIGHRDGHLWVVAEKEGHWPLLECLHDELDVTVMALGGFPSLLSTERFVRQYSAITHRNRHIQLYLIVDYDPSGWLIADSFIDQLRNRGLNHPITQTHLVDPDRMSLDQLRLHRFPIKGRQHSRRNRDWIARGGGLERFDLGKYLAFRLTPCPGSSSAPTSSNTQPSICARTSTPSSAARPHKTWCAPSRACSQSVF